MISNLFAPLYPRYRIVLSVDRSIEIPRVGKGEKEGNAKEFSPKGTARRLVAYQRLDKRVKVLHCFESRYLEPSFSSPPPSALGSACPPGGQ